MRMNPVWNRVKLQLEMIRKVRVPIRSERNDLVEGGLEKAHEAHDPVDPPTLKVVWKQ
jgi:hypothetical protein